MSSGKFKGAAFAFCLTLLLGVMVLHLNLVERVAFAVEKARLQTVDDRLPTVAEVNELARINRWVARKAIPAVVHILTQTQLNERHRSFFGGPLMRGQGSGVIIDAKEGYILTNNHVVGNADEIKVSLDDGRQYDARLVGSDPPTDLAVIKIDADHLFELPIGDSDALEVGDPVMTIGNPFGYEGSISKGIVSAKDRVTVVGLLDYEGFIQTDAVINPGNSGGPLVNMRAEIIGISTAIETANGSFSGVGLAIPSSRIHRVLPALLKGEKIVRGYLGVMMVSSRYARPRATELGWTETYGVLISDVISDSPAAEAGLEAADILVNLNGDRLDESSKLTDTIAYTAPGTTIVFDVWRDGHLVSLQATVGEQPEGFTTRTRPPSRRLPPWFRE